MVRKKHGNMRMHIDNKETFDENPGRPKCMQTMTARCDATPLSIATKKQAID
jgi:hypothetical protein